MSNSLTYCDLPSEIYQWPGLPLSLSGDEVMPLDYRAGHTGWLLYGRKLDKQRITDFQRQLGAAMVIVSAWCVEDYQVIRLAGSLTPRIKTLADESGLDVAPLGRYRIYGLPACWSWIWIPPRSKSNALMKLPNWQVWAMRWRRSLNAPCKVSWISRPVCASGGGTERTDANILKQVRDDLPLMPVGQPGA